MLVEKQLFGTVDKVKLACDRLKYFKPSDGYYLAFSGGKDSVVIKRLADMAGVKYDAHYSVTTIDPPELIYFIREYHPDVIWERPEVPFLRKLETKGFPMRRGRWCCELYKENGGNGRRVVTGVRWGESYIRRQRKIFGHCFGGGYKSKNKTILNPIADWSTEDVWSFIRQEKLPYCMLYDIGFNRLGCLFCPLARVQQRMVEADHYPGYVKSFVRSFEKLHAYRKNIGKAASVDRWSNGESMFWWWLGENQKSEDKLQRMLFE